MNYKNVINYKALVLVSAVTALTACGGSGGNSANTAPTLDTSVLPDLSQNLVNRESVAGSNNGGASYQDLPATTPSYILPTTSANAEANMGCAYEDVDVAVPVLVCDFYESAIWATELQERRRHAVSGEVATLDNGDDYQYPVLSSSFEISMLSGVMDSDFGDALSVENLHYVFFGVNCFNIRNNPFLVEENEELCGSENNIDSLIAALPAEDQIEYVDLATNNPDDPDTAENELTVAKLLRYRTRQGQSFPRYEIEYGFEQTTFGFKVTPKELVPILRAGEFASIEVTYDISDGTDMLPRRMRINIHGESYAPIEDMPMVFSGGEDVLFTEIYDLSSGMSDQDIEIQEALVAEWGPLENKYNLTATTRDYLPQAIRIRNFMPIDGTPSSSASSPDTAAWEYMQIDNGVVWRVNGVEVDGDTGVDSLDRTPTNFYDDSWAIQIRPALFAPDLETGESQVLRFSYEVGDTDELNFGQVTTRIFEYTIVGSTTATAPTIPSTPFTKAFGGAMSDFSLGDTQVIDLLEGVVDLEGEAMSIVNFNDGGAGAIYGIDTSQVLVDGTITIDSSPFWIVPAEDTRDFTFTYQVSDGTLTSEERTLTVTITGEDQSLLVQLGGTTGFEGETLGAGTDTWRARFPGTASSIVGETGGVVPYAGASMLRLDTTWSTVSTRDGLIPAGTIQEGATYYTSYWVHSSDVGQVASGVSPAAWGQASPQVFERVTVAGEWREYISYFTAEANDPLALWLHNPWSDSPTNTVANEVFFDDVRLVEYEYNPLRDFASDSGAQDFEAGSAGDWITENATVVVGASAAAGGTTNGLMVDTAGQAAAFTLTLPGSSIPDGAIQEGGRYRVAFNMQFPAYATSADDTAVTVTFFDTASPGTTYTQEIVLNSVDWTWMDYNINLPTGGFDWSTADVGIMISFNRADAVFYLDDVTIYQLP